MKKQLFFLNLFFMTFGLTFYQINTENIDVENASLITNSNSDKIANALLKTSENKKNDSQKNRIEPKNKSAKKSKKNNKKERTNNHSVMSQDPDTAMAKALIQVSKDLYLESSCTLDKNGHKKKCCENAIKNQQNTIKNQKQLIRQEKNKEKKKYLEENLKKMQNKLKELQNKQKELCKNRSKSNKKPKSGLKITN